MRWPAAWSTILLLPRWITMTEADSEISLTFARGLALLRAFDADGKGMTVADLARRLDYTRAATRRLVRTLEMAGYVTADGTRYMLTPLVLKLGLGFLQSRSIGRLVGPVLHGESLALGEPISLALLSGRELVYVVHAPTSAKIETAGYTIGSSLPLTATAMGQATLAFRHAPDLSVQDGPVTDQGLATIRARGFAHVPDTDGKGFCAIAVPAFGLDTDAAVGALGIVYPNGRYGTDHLLDVIVPNLQKCARYIAMAL
ncbi:IclR family transcriptional regulator [Komagataeibacter rhaeticus]|uniref:IclR family transcriptional regulator n=2 Tax=Komagataeibacter rhaeticus TaxID=215221 RepID=UPI0002F4581B|nr:helix-turn-helix domain-containing protein [Komagataeibacter rhaeticus]WPP22555.1 helix-turn-helix domain-containing protein [Komagataeibacter rhaeticus]